MTPEERAEIAKDELLGLLPGVRHWAIFDIVLRHIEAAVADAEADHRHEWQENVRLVHGEGDKP